MKYLPLIILIITTLISCKPTTEMQASGNKYFEGFVETSESYSGTGHGTIKHLEKKYGKRVITYVSAGGFISRAFIDSNGIILTRVIYRPDSLKFYTFYSNSDTVYAKDITYDSWNTTLLGLTSKSTFKILGHNVDIIKLRLQSNDSSKPIRRWQNEYYVDPNYPVNPLVYKNIVNEGFGEAFSNSPYLIVGRKYTYNDAVTTLATANRIVPTKVPAWHFEIPRNKVIIEQ